MANLINYNVASDFLEKFPGNLQEQELSFGQSILQVLVWEAPVFRIFIESIPGLVLFQGINHFWVDKSYANLMLVQISILSIISLLIIFFDRRLFCQSLVAWEKSTEYAISGDTSTAEFYLKKSLNSIIPPPKDRGLLKTIELNLMLGKNSEALKIFSNAKSEGLSRFKAELSKYRGLMFSNVFKLEDPIFDLEIEALPEPLIQIERAMFALFRENDPNSASQLASLVNKLPAKIHPSNTSTHELSYLVGTLAALHQGKAETVLPKLSLLLDFLRFQINNVPDLRPYLSFSLLERAKYFAKRSKTKSNALSDVRLALAICKYPAHERIANEIRTQCGIS